MPVKTNYIMFEISFSWWHAHGCVSVSHCIIEFHQKKKKKKKHHLVKKRKKECDSSQKFENFAFL